MKGTTMKALILLAQAAAIAVLLSSPASAFKCESEGTIFSPAGCTCKGTDDCKDMRKSKMCKGDLDCKQGKCTCTAAFTPADDGGEIKKKVTGGVLKKTQPLTAD
jgi:hypothetical protein